MHTTDTFCFSEKLAIPRYKCNNIHENLAQYFKAHTITLFIHNAVQVQTQKWGKLSSQVVYSPNYEMESKQLIYISTVMQQTSSTEELKPAVRRLFGLISLCTLQNSLQKVSTAVGRQIVNSTAVWLHIRAAIVDQ